MMSSTPSQAPDRKEAGVLSALQSSLMQVQAELSLAELIGLIVVRLNPGISVNELAELTRLPQQTASRHVGRLSGRYQSVLGPEVPALLELRISEADPRRRALFLTAAGEDYVGRVIDPLFRERANVSVS